MIIIILYILFIILSAYIDAEHINDKDYIENHTSRFLLRGVVTLGFAYDPSYFYFFDWRYLLVFLLSFIAIFDTTINLFRGLSVFYLGTVAKWDLFWKKHYLLYKIMRISLIIPITYLIVQIL